MTFRPYHRTRVLLDYQEYLQYLDAPVLICTNRSILTVLRVLVESYGRRRANWVTAHYPGGYTDIDDAQLDVIDAGISLFLSETDDMSFCDDIVTQLANIATAIAASGCGCGAGGAGSTTEPPATPDLGLPPGQTGTTPEGFSTWAEYNTYKCDMIEYIIQQIEADIAWWQSANFATLALSAFVAALVTPVPGDEIIALLGFLAALALQGVQAAALAALDDAVTNSRANLVCALYYADTATASKSNVDAAIDDAIDAETSAIYAGLLKSILKSMFNQTLINHLYVRWDEKADVLPTGTCTTCTCDPTTEIGTYNGSGDWSTEFWSPATDPPGKNVIQFVFKDGGGTVCEVDDLVITPTNINPSPPEAYPGYKLYNKVGTLIYNSDTVPPSTDNVHKVVIQSNTAGSVVVTWTQQ